MSAIRRKNEKYSAGVPELRKTAENFMSLFGDIPACVFIIDSGCNIIFSNSSVSPAKSVSRPELENAFVFNRGGACFDASGAPIPVGNGPVSRAVKEKRSFSNMEIGYRLQDGKVLWFNLSVNFCGRPVPCAVAAYFEITNLKNIQRELEETWLRYKTLLSGLPDTVIVHADGKILFSNAQIRSFLGYRPYEITRKNLADLLSADSPEAAEALLSHEKDIRTRFEAVFVAADGRKKNAAVKSFKISFNDRPARLLIVEDITRQKRMEQDIIRVKQQLMEKNTHGNIIGKSDSILNIIKLIPGIASIGCNVLLLGESGTGKSMVAGMLHESSARKGGPFVTVNCGAIPETLFESEFFGYVKGAFTDAKSDTKGKFAAAEGGTIFLDEISEIPLKLQVKLLKVIEEKKFEPLGSSASRKVDVRIIAATNRDLAGLVRNGKFREDLFYRLNVVNVKMPPLRERREDVELLADYFISQFNEMYSKNILGVGENLRRFLYQYDFPGNIRELRNMIEHACIFCGDRYIDVADLSEEYLEAYSAAKVFRPNMRAADSCEEPSRDEAVAAARPVTAGLHGDGVSADAKAGEKDWPDRLEKFEKEAIAEALEKFGQNRAKVMKYLNMSRMTLWRKMKRYGLL